MFCGVEGARPSKPESQRGGLAEGLIRRMRGWIDALNQSRAPSFSAPRRHFLVVGGAALLSACATPHTAHHLDPNALAEMRREVAADVHELVQQGEELLNQLRQTGDIPGMQIFFFSGSVLNQLTPEDDALMRIINGGNTFLREFYSQQDRRVAKLAALEALATERSTLARELAVLVVKIFNDILPASEEVTPADEERGKQILLERGELVLRSLRQFEHTLLAGMPHING